MRIDQFVERDEWVLAAVTGQKILHLGCVGLTDGRPEEKVKMANHSLHARVTHASASCTGIDLDAAAIREWRNLGLFANVIEGNVEHLENLPKDVASFDIVLAGDIIEHISNPGLMLDGIKDRLKPEGRLIVSTPNSFGLASWVKYLRGSFREGAQHVLCFNPINLRQLLERHGYEVELAMTSYQARAAGQYGMAFRFLRKGLEWFPQLGGTLLYVCKIRK